jgi:pentatricopeptide repeat protein
MGLGEIDPTKPDPIAGMMDAYGRVGCLAEMWDVLNMMKLERIRPDKVTCTTMIKWFLVKGIDDHRVQYLRDLKDGRSTDDKQA